MNENIDLTKILDGCPKGTKFYSSVFGDVCFEGVRKKHPYPIKFSLYKETNAYGVVTKEGTYSKCYNGECILFPSKDQRDWSKFVRFWDKFKIKKFDPKTFQAFDEVLVRMGTNYDSGEWHIDFFEYFDEKK